MNSFFRLQYLKIKKLLDTYFSEHALHARYAAFVAVGFFTILIVAFNVVLPPHNFPTGTLVTIERGMTLREITEMLEKDRVVRSALFLSIFVEILGAKHGALHGQYFFEVPENSFGIARRLATGKFGLDPIRITIPEGATAREIGEVLEWKLPSFPTKEFLSIAIPEEGYLFPDTYFFLPNVSPREIVRTMRENFEKKLLPLHESIPASGKTLEEIIIMASIIEKETIVQRDMELVSGILWKRVRVGMPLQVDAPFVYAIGKNTFELTYDDLESSQPYNTYKYLGLPPGPIANPGIRAIQAALTPKESSYFFYLSDRRGTIHYAATFEEHKKNKRRYLN